MLEILHKKEYKFLELVGLGICLQIAVMFLSLILYMGNLTYFIPQNSSNAAMFFKDELNTYSMYDFFKVYGIMVLLVLAQVPLEELVFRFIPKWIHKFLANKLQFFNNNFNYTYLLFAFISAFIFAIGHSLESLESITKGFPLYAFFVAFILSFIVRDCKNYIFSALTIHYVFNFISMFLLLLVYLMSTYTG